MGKRFSFQLFLLSLMAASLLLKVMMKLTFYSHPALSETLGILRNAAIFTVLAVWGASIRFRVAQKNAAVYLSAIAALMLLWFILRTCKFSMTDDRDAARFCWYGYYIPLIMIPLMSLFTAMCVGRSESYRIPHGLKALYAPALLLTAAVFTNDIHNKVFCFASGRPVPPGDPEYSYSFIYFVIVLWIAALEVVMLGVLIKRVRLPGRQGIVWLPFAPVALGLLYTAGYVIHVPALFIIFGDMTTFICFINIGIWESCIYSGLIKNRVFDRIVPEVAPQLRRIEGIIEGLASQVNVDDSSGCAGSNAQNDKNYRYGNFKGRLAEICLLGAYVKRRLNLMLYDNYRSLAPAEDMFLCVKESADYLALSGVVCSVESSASGASDAASIAALYDAFEMTAERAAKISECMLTNITSSAGELTVKMTLDTEKDNEEPAGTICPIDETALREFMRRRGGSASVIYDEGDVFVTLTMPRHSAKNVYGMLSIYGGMSVQRGALQTAEDAEDGRHGGLAARCGRFYKRLTDKKRAEAAEAKVIIHDRMGRALITTKKFLNDPLEDGGADAESILIMWKKCLDMFSEEDNANDEAGSLAAAGSGAQLFDARRAIAQLNEAAEAVGVRIVVDGRMPVESQECMRLIILAARECLTNAIRHADADMLQISIGAAPGQDGMDSEGMLRVVFSDNGRAASSDEQPKTHGKDAPRERREGGGLSGLRWHVERKGGRMQTEWSDGFRVILTLPSDM